MRYGCDGVRGEGVEWVGWEGILVVCDKIDETCVLVRKENWKYM